MAERNSFVSYPKEILSTQSELETYTAGIAQGEPLVSYETLPSVINATGIEGYANWLSELTNIDPKHYERGTTIFFDKRKFTLVFPSNPQIGDGVITLYYPNNSNCVPVMASHSHPDSSAFSGPDGDLAYMLGAHKGPAPLAYIPAMQVATTKYNYLLLRTQETVPSDETNRYWRSGILDGFNNDPEVKEIFEFFSYENQYGTGLSIEDFRSLQWISGVNLSHPSSFDVFFHCHFILPITNYYASQKHKLGFYYSEKNGRYVHLTKSRIIQLVAEVVRARFDITKLKLENK